MLFSSTVRVWIRIRVRIRFSVGLVSCCAHVFVQLKVVIVTDRFRSCFISLFSSSVLEQMADKLPFLSCYVSVGERTSYCNIDVSTVKIVCYVLLFFGLLAQALNVLLSEI